MSTVTTKKRQMTRAAGHKNECKSYESLLTHDSVLSASSQDSSTKNQPYNTDRGVKIVCMRQGTHVAPSLPLHDRVTPRKQLDDSEGDVKNVCMRQGAHVAQMSLSLLPVSSRVRTHCNKPSCELPTATPLSCPDMSKASAHEIWSSARCA